MPIPAIAAALAPSLFELGESIVQKQKAKSLKPSNYVPPAVEAATDMARKNAATTTAPGFDRTRQMIRTSTANTISRARQVAGDSGQLQSQVATSDANEKNSEANLGTQNQQFQFNNRQDLMKWLGIKGQFQQNSRDSYNAAKSALTGASNQNAFNALTGASTIGIKALGAEPGSLIGKTGVDLTKAIQNSTSFTDEEKAYLKSLGYNVDSAPNFGGMGSLPPSARLATVNAPY